MTVGSNTFEVEDMTRLRAWLVATGYAEEPAAGQWEIARFRKTTPSGALPPVLVYRGKYGITRCFPNGNTIDPALISAEPPLPLEAEPARTNEVGGAVTPPTSADDLPW